MVLISLLFVLLEVITVSRPLGVVGLWVLLGSLLWLHEVAAAMMQRFLLFPLPPSVLLVPDVTGILLTVGFPEGMHFVVIDVLERHGNKQWKAYQKAKEKVSVVLRYMNNGRKIKPKINHVWARVFGISYALGICSSGRLQTRLLRVWWHDTTMWTFLFRRQSLHTIAVSLPLMTFITYPPQLYSCSCL